MQELRVPNASLVGQAVNDALCCSPTTFTHQCIAAMPHQGGLFSQLNYVAEQVLGHLYLGRGPVNASAILDLPLYGYGGVLTCKNAERLWPDNPPKCHKVTIGRGYWDYTVTEPKRLSHFFGVLECPRAYLLRRRRRKRPR